MLPVQKAKKKWMFLASVSLCASASLSHAQQYSPVSPLPFARVKHGSTIVQDHLYVIAGDSPTGFTSSVASAKINDDRSLSPWSENQALPVNLIEIGNSVFSVGNTIFVAGGEIVDESNAAANYGRTPNQEIFYSTAAENGSLGPWERAPGSPSAAMVGAAAASDGITIYMVGGETVDGEPSAEVYFAELGFDGSISEWKPTAELLEPLSFHTLLFHAGNLYTIGGKTGSSETPVSDRVYESVLQPDGSLAEWTLSENRLKSPVYGAAGTASDAYFFLFCGQSSTYVTLNKIQYAQLTPTGITTWDEVGTDIPARAHAAVVMDPFRRALYITGGQSSMNYLDVSAGVFCYPLVGAGSSSTSRNTTASQPRTTSSETACLDISTARSKAERENRNMLILFYANNVPASVTMKDTLSNSSSFFSELSIYAIPVAVEAFENTSLASRYSVNRVPTYVLVRPDMSEIRSEYGCLTQQQVCDLAK